MLSSFSGPEILTLMDWSSDARASAFLMTWMTPSYAVASSSQATKVFWTFSAASLSFLSPMRALTSEIDFCKSSTSLAGTWTLSRKDSAFATLELTLSRVPDLACSSASIASSTASRKSPPSKDCLALSNSLVQTLTSTSSILARSRLSFTARMRSVTLRTLISFSARPLASRVNSRALSKSPLSKALFPLSSRSRAPDMSMDFFLPSAMRAAADAVVSWTFLYRSRLRFAPRSQSLRATRP